MVFVCAAFTLDIFCLIFVPLHWLFFAASTYVLLNYIWHTGEQEDILTGEINVPGNLTNVIRKIICVH